MLAINAQKILKSHQLKATLGRIAVLELFLNSHKALSHGEIEERLKESQVDRVTIYRILDCFVANKIIHKVSSEQALQLFALSHEHADDETGKHAHFVCDTCETVECVDLPVSVATQEVKNKLGYSISTVDITLHGICSHCKN